LASVPPPRKPSISALRLASVRICAALSVRMSLRLWIQAHSFVDQLADGGYLTFVLVEVLCRFAWLGWHPA
jgi:hypothetical protein